MDFYIFIQEIKREFEFFSEKKLRFYQIFRFLNQFFPSKIDYLCFQRKDLEKFIFNIFFETISK